MKGHSSFLSKIGTILSAPFRAVKKRIFRHHDAVIEKKVRRELEVTLSHELRTPLTVIFGYSEILLENFERADQDNKSENAEAALAIHRKSKVLLRFIDNTILSTMLDFHPQIFHSQPLDLGLAVENAVGEWKKFSEARDGIELEMRIEHSLHYDVNEKLIKIAVFELVDNAYTYRRPGIPCQITVELSRSGDSVRLSVRDNGIGIKEKYRDRIYDKFFRIEDRDTAETSGLGIGLSLVRHIVDLYGGTITLESIHMKGSAFFIDLPSKGTRT